MYLKAKNRRAIINALKFSDKAIEELPKLPQPGNFPPPGFIFVDLPIPEAQGFDQCYLFKNGIVLASRSGFNFDQLKKLNQGAQLTHLIHHYGEGNTVLSHSNYMWLDMQTFLVNVFAPG